MAKWADYLIFAVHYNADHSRIENVKCYQDMGDTLGTTVILLSREQVIGSIEAGNTYMTITRNNDGKWKQGARVEIITVNYKKYIRTDRNRTEKDNLENLEEF